MMKNTDKCENFTSHTMRAFAVISSVSEKSQPPHPPKEGFFEIPHFVRNDGEILRFPPARK